MCMYLHCRPNDGALLLPMNQTVVHECNVEHVGRESVILKITDKAQQARCGGGKGVQKGRGEGEIRGQE